MIPKAHIRQWREKVSWSRIEMIEHSLVIGKALICLYSNPLIRDSLVFRGGTALNVLYLSPPSRYSEDIDLVLIVSEPVGRFIDAIRAGLDSWLGKPHRKVSRFGVKLTYSYFSENVQPMKLKIEINNTEHFSILALLHVVRRGILLIRAGLMAHVL